MKKEDKFISTAFYFPSTSAKSLEEVEEKGEIFRRKECVHAEGCGWPMAIQERSAEVQDWSSPGINLPFTACANIKRI